jgi:hypothetical protein
MVMADLWLAPYEEAIGEFPVTGTPAEQWRAILVHAVRAPSVHNTQPWWCRIDGSALEVFADRTRALPIADPTGRELMMSVGALVEHLVIVAGRFGREVSVAATPGQGDVVATLELGAFRPVDPADRALFDAIPRRRTNRRPFLRQAVPDPVRELARRLVRQRGADLTFISAVSRRRALAEIVSDADRIQLANPAFRAELASWLRWLEPNRPDGIPARSGKAPALVRPVAPLAVRTVDVGKGAAAYDRRLMASSPVLAILTTERDDAGAWLDAGRAMARGLLSLTAEGVSASFLNQAVEVPELRTRVRGFVRTRGFPQAILRLGFGARVPPTPRRPIDEIVRD